LKQERVEELAVIGIIVAVLIYELHELRISHGDLALQWIRSQYNDSIFMYSRFWTWLNPFYLTEYLYKIYLGIFVIIVATIQWVLFKKKKLPIEVMLMTQLSNIFWFWIGGWQNVTTTAIISFSFWNPVMLIVYFIVKFPFGWSLSLSDSHWQCVIGAQKIFFPFDGQTVQICGPGTFWVNPYAIAWHLVELGWIVGVVTYWTWRWKLLQRIWKLW